MKTEDRLKVLEDLYKDFEKQEEWWLQRIKDSKDSVFISSYKANADGYNFAKHAVKAKMVEIKNTKEEKCDNDGPRTN